MYFVECNEHLSKNQLRILGKVRTTGRIICKVSGKPLCCPYFRHGDEVLGHVITSQILEEEFIA